MRFLIDNNLLPVLVESPKAAGMTWRTSGTSAWRSNSLPPPSTAFRRWADGLPCTTPIQPASKLDHAGYVPKSASAALQPPVSAQVSGLPRAAGGLDSGRPWVSRLCRTSLATFWPGKRSDRGYAWGGRGRRQATSAARLIGPRELRCRRPRCSPRPAAATRRTGSA
jgi:hypothetical protein